MKAIENILQKRFGNSKKLSIFVVPNILTSVKSSDFTGSRLNKAGFFLNIFSSQRDECLATSQKGLASFVVHISQILRFKMPNTPKNLNAAAPGAAASTGRNRNSAPVVTQSATTQSQLTFNYNGTVSVLWQISQNGEILRKNFRSLSSARYFCEQVGLDPAI
ncbi:MAG: hypothetical protein RR551_08180 [Mucinivorans sp.]